MRYNLLLKIGGIMACVLVIMAVMTLLTVRQTAQINRELGKVAEQYVPFSEAVSSVDRNIVKQGMALQRLFALMDGRTDQRGQEQVRGEFEDLGNRISLALELMETMLVHIQDGDILRENFREITETHQALEEHGTLLLAVLSGGDTQMFDALLPELDSLHESVDLAIGEARRHLNNLTGESVAHATRKEELLFSEADLEKVWKLRRRLSGSSSQMDGLKTFL